MHANGLFSTGIILTHIVGATIALIAGALVMILRKGTGLHRAAGTIFAISMLGMSTAGLVLAGALRPNAGNVMGAMLAMYLVGTGWAAGRRGIDRVTPLDRVALLFALVIIFLGARWGIEASGTARGIKDGYPAPFFFVFGSIAALFAISDIRVQIRGRLEGMQRLTRHLWRMCLAFLMALMSFYPGQAKLFPTELRATKLLLVPHVLLLGAIAFWMFRMARRRRAAAASSRAAIIGTDASIA
jgi:hypothetical protein